MNRLQRAFSVLFGRTDVLLKAQSDIYFGTGRGNFDTTQPNSLAVAQNCVKILGETLGKIPAEVYMLDSAKGKIKDKKFYLYDLVHSMPNPWTNNNTFFQTLEYHRNFTGNSFAEIIRDGGTGRVLKLIIIAPSRLKGYGMEKDELYYKVEDEDGNERMINSSNLLHFRMQSPDGIWGFDPIKSLYLNMSTMWQGQKTMDSFYKNDAISPKAISTTGGAGAKKYMDEARKEFESQSTGAGNAGKAIWLPPNTTISDLSINLESAQMLESLRFNSQQISALYGVPIFKATGDYTQSKFNSIEQIQIDFKQNIESITAMYRREMEMKLLTEKDKGKGRSIEFNVDSLISPDTKTKAEYWRVLFNTAAITPKQIATLANLPSEGLSEDTWVQTNMQSVQVYEQKNSQEAIDNEIKKESE